jgi:hypothetical protein
MAKKILTLIFATVILFSSAACATNIDKRYNGLSIGFSFTGPHYSPIMYAVRSDEVEFNVDNVTLDFYYGWFGELPYWHTDKTLGYDVCVAFYVTTREVGQWIDPQVDYQNVENQYFITEVSAEEFWSESFIASQTKSKGKIFNHSGKSITIPKEAFSKQEGILELYAQIISYSYEDELFNFDSSYSSSWYTIYIHYNYISDNTVKLYRR